MMNEQLSFPFEIKSTDEGQGVFVGLASVYGNVDRQNDVVEPGAFKRTLKALGGEVPILWQHWQDQPIGMGHLEDSPRGLKIKGELYMDIPQAQNAFRLLRPKEGFKRPPVRGLSIGYQTKQDEWKGDVRHLKEVELFEVSLVTVPANPRALVGSAKAHHARLDQLQRDLEEIKSTLLEHGIVAMDGESDVGPTNKPGNTGELESLNELTESLAQSRKLQEAQECLSNLTRSYRSGSSFET